MAMQLLSKVIDDRGEVEEILPLMAGALGKDGEKLLEAISEERRAGWIWRGIERFPPAARLDVALGQLFGDDSEIAAVLTEHFPESSAEETLALWRSEISL